MTLDWCGRVPRDRELAQRDTEGFHISSWMTPSATDVPGAALVILGKSAHRVSAADVLDGGAGHVTLLAPQAPK